MQDQATAPAPRQRRGCLFDIWMLAATCDQLAEELRVRLACRGERYEVTTRRPALSDPSPQTTWVLRGKPGEQTTWDDACAYCHAPRADARGGWRLDRNYLVVETG